MAGRTRGTIRASKGYAIFRLVFGLIFIGLGFSQYQRGGPFVNTAYVSFLIGALFAGYGVIALFSSKSLGAQIEMEAATPTERLNELSQLKASGTISDAEFEAKRQDILKDL